LTGGTSSNESIVSLCGDICVSCLFGFASKLASLSLSLRRERRTGSLGGRGGGGGGRRKARYRVCREARITKLYLVLSRTVNLSSLVREMHSMFFVDA
jgi:hypothetical protein